MLKRIISAALAAVMLITTIPTVITSADNTVSFTDVKEDAWYYTDVMDITSKGIMKGTSSTRFSPTDTLSRAMCVTILHRMSGESAPTEENTGFIDVPSDTWYSEAVAWAHELGIVKGKTETQFAPNDNITRAEFVTVLSRYAYHMELELPEIREGSLRDSMLTPEYAKLSEQLMYRAGVVNGLPGDRFVYYAEMTRAEAAAMINRFIAKATKLDPDEYLDVVFIGNSITQSGRTRDHFEALADGKNIKVYDYSDGGRWLTDHYEWFKTNAMSPYVNTVEEAEIVILQEFGGGFPPIGVDEELQKLRDETNYVGASLGKSGDIVGDIKDILGHNKTYYSFSAGMCLGPMKYDEYLDWNGNYVANDNNAMLQIQKIYAERYDLNHIFAADMSAFEPELGLGILEHMYPDMLHPTELMGYCIALSNYCSIFDLDPTEQNNGDLTWEKVPGETDEEKSEFLKKLKIAVGEMLDMQQVKAYGEQ